MRNEKLETTNYDSQAQSSLRKRWFTVYTQPHKEEKATFNLRLQDFTVFHPTLMKTVRHARKLRTVRSPLFPRYIFVGLDPDRTQWRCINGTLGVSRIVTADGRPSPVAAGLIEALITVTDDRQVIRSDFELRVGDKVEMLAGPFTGVVAELVRLDSAGRVKLLLQAMGGNIPVQADTWMVRRLAVA